MWPRLVCLVLLTLGCSGAPEPTDSSLRVVGGVPTPAPPAFAALYWSGATDPHCGAVLIAEDEALTAAHCVRPSEGPLELKLGLSRLGERKTAIPVLAVDVHERYHKGQITYDLARLLLPKGRSRKPLPLADGARPRGPLFVYGFGSTGGWNAAYPDVLQKAQLDYISSGTCLSLGGPYAFLLEEQACAGVLESGARDSCYGDSGGPLIAEGPNGPELFGLVSWGMGCGQAGAPGVYTRLALFEDWLTHRREKLLTLAEQIDQLFHYPLIVTDGTRTRRFSAVYQSWRSDGTHDPNPALANWTARDNRNETWTLQLLKQSGARYLFRVTGPEGTWEAAAPFSEL